MDHHIDTSADEIEAAPPHMINGPNGRIACRRVVSAQADDLPGLVWLGGFRSDMLGSKAEYVEAWARERGVSSLRFDYSGHGESEGNFRDGTISAWARDAQSAIAACTKGPQILVGSSMGGWIAMLQALHHPETVAGLVLIAPAPDFTESLMWATMDPVTRAVLERDGYIETPSDYSDEPDIITRALIEDGRTCLVLDKIIPVTGPVRILQGMKDADVPFEHALKAVPQFASDNVVTTLVKNGDHRLSGQADLSRLGRTLEEVIQEIQSEHI